MNKLEKVIHRDGFNHVVTTTNIAAGKVLYIMSGTIKSEPDKYSIQIGQGLHIMDKFGMYINHSFSPNVQISGKTIISLRDITEGEEITFNYLENEDLIFSPFICKESGIRVKKDA